MSEPSFQLPAACKGVPLFQAVIDCESSTVIEKVYIALTLADTGKLYRYDLRDGENNLYVEGERTLDTDWRGFKRTPNDFREHFTPFVCNLIVDWLHDKEWTLEQAGMVFRHHHSLDFNGNATHLLDPNEVHAAFDEKLPFISFKEFLTPLPAYFASENPAPVAPVVHAARIRLSKEDWLKANYPELKELPKWRFPANTI